MITAYFSSGRLAEARKLLLTSGSVVTLRRRRDEDDDDEGTLEMMMKSVSLAAPPRLRLCLPLLLPSGSVVTLRRRRDEDDDDEGTLEMMMKSVSLAAPPRLRLCLPVRCRRSALFRLSPSASLLFDLFQQMRLEGQNPSQYTLASTLRVCSMLGLIQSGELTHGYVLKSGLESNVCVLTSLVDVYAECTRKSQAKYLFKFLPNSRENHVLWTSMLSGYAHNGDGHKAIEFFCDMHKEGVELNRFTFPSILTACSAVSSRCFAEQVRGCIVQIWD
ncbi:pentatricopeptide repeat-containing protein At1g74600, chloroplastic-like [Neltuma alba]|uniref:pentatricopeptide repeat-containing protein At1g74600, chloroplastic-like n=1 Tax=Neltuma alba TaxID=207710 RepID=UPI0010A317B6|nr:pentatricopeptide repeat-containing protein At1g74600, chloroplastic-like [Prosopis alba]